MYFDDNWKNLRDRVSQLSLAELVALFYQASRDLHVQKGPEVFDAYVLGHSGFDPGRAHDTYFLAEPQAGFSSVGRLDRPGQFGKCRNCQAQIQSFTKDAICPICRSEVECT